MKFRHEWKHEINHSDMLALRSRLQAVMVIDSHTINGKYEIRSLYFDNIQDKALLEKINGVNMREKFRVRYYNGDTSFILLEKKRKINGLCQKEQAQLSAAEAQAISDRNMDMLGKSKKPLIQELYLKMQTQGLQPKTIVDYTREAFVYAPGNVRITLDRDIRTGLSPLDFLRPERFVLKPLTGLTVLEVKYDAFLPDLVRMAVQIPDRRAGACSKYALCRRFD